MAATYLFTLNLLDEDQCNSEMEFYINHEPSKLTLEIFADNGIVYEVISDIDEFINNLVKAKEALKDPLKLKEIEIQNCLNKIPSSQYRLLEEHFKSKFLEEQKESLMLD